MGPHELSGNKFSTLQDIVFFYAPMIHPSYMPEKCQGLLGVKRKRAVAASVQLAAGGEPRPALCVRNVFWSCWSADQSHIKRQWKLILILHTGSVWHLIELLLKAKDWFTSLLLKCVDCPNASDVCWATRCYTLARHLVSDVPSRNCSSQQQVSNHVRPKTLRSTGNVHDDEAVRTFRCRLQIKKQPRPLFLPSSGHVHGLRRFLTEKIRCMWVSVLQTSSSEEAEDHTRRQMVAASQSA